MQRIQCPVWLWLVHQDSYALAQESFAREPRTGAGGSRAHAWNKAGASVLLLKADHCDAGGHVETRIAFDADRLQRYRFVEAADQHVGTDAADHRGTGRRTG